MSEDLIEIIVAEHEQQCSGAVTAFKRDLGKSRSGRASSGLVEGITVEAYGAKMPLAQLAQISTPEPRLIALQVYDSTTVAAIEKAIIASDLGFNPSSDGNLIRINVPALTEQSRKDLIKHLHKMAEDIKISVRNHRRDANEKIKKLEKDSSVSKDISQKAQDEIQKQTDTYISQVEAALAAKEAETMEV